MAFSDPARAKEYARLNRIANREKRNAYNREYFLANPGKLAAKKERSKPKLKQYFKNYRAAHRAERNAYNKNYLLEHPEKAEKKKQHGKEYYKRYYQANKVTIRAKGRAWSARNQDYQKKLRVKHPARFREYAKRAYQKAKPKMAAYLRNRRKTDIEFRIVDNLRRRVNHALNGTRKSNKTKTMLGCSGEFLRGFLEARFKDGMSWENYGEWHIDHIIPCAEFDMTIPTHQHQCFHYSNLQPLWGVDNMRKHTTVPHNHQPEFL